jgi:hypothetical protein
MLEFLLIFSAIIFTAYFALRILKYRMLSAGILKMLALGIDGLEQEITATTESTQDLEKKRLVLPLLKEAHSKAEKLHQSGKYKQAVESLEAIAKKLKELRTDDHDEE